MEAAWFGSGAYVEPQIYNNAAGNNFVHGIAYQP